MFGNKKQIGMLIELLDEEHKKRVALRRRVKELEGLLSESENIRDMYSFENVKLHRELQAALSADEKEKLLAENKKLFEEKEKMRRWNEALLRFNDTLDMANRKLSERFVKEKLLPLQTENEAYRAANRKLRENLAALKGEQKKDG